ncbi:MAG: D-2-hydroxyacid dehydrogenase [Clostridia bacterium]|nr:D-2-hydroxyacid dehydrogenase [Clostridia bacterium]
MGRKMIVVNGALEEKHRALIRAAAERHFFEVSFYTNDAEALPHLTDAEIVFGQSAALAKHCPALRWQCTPSAGADQFRGEAAFAAGQAVLTNSSGAYGVTIAEHIVMVTLEVLRRQQEYSGLVARRQWRRDLPVRSIRGSRVTLVGTGDIGQEAAIRLRAFGPACLRGVNRSGGNPGGLFDQVCRQERLEALLPETDILILSLPGTPETFHILSAQRLALLPDGALIVNVGRGTAVDQAALERELRAGRLQAALDVFEQEPLPADDPLWDCPGLLLTPHVAGNMTLPYTRDRIVALFLEDFENYCAGRPLQRQVDLKKGY